MSLEDWAAVAEFFSKSHRYISVQLSKRLLKQAPTWFGHCAYYQRSGRTQSLTRVPGLGGIAPSHSLGTEMQIFFSRSPGQVSAAHLCTAEVRDQLIHEYREPDGGETQEGVEK